MSTDRKRLPFPLAPVLLAGACLVGSGCVNTILRAIVDPSGLVKSAAAATLESTVGPLVTRSEAETIASTERMVDDLRRIISENPDAQNREELNRMAERLEDDLTTYRATRAEADGAKLRTRDEGCHLWRIEDPSRAITIHVRDDLRAVNHQVHTLEEDHGNRRLLSMKAKLLGGERRFTTDAILLKDLEVGPPIRSDYQAGGWGDDPPPDSMLSSPPPPR